MPKKRYFGQRRLQKSKFSRVLHAAKRRKHELSSLDCDSSEVSIFLIFAVISYSPMRESHYNAATILGFEPEIMLSSKILVSCRALLRRSHWT
jgi:hypothetical protein